MIQATTVTNNAELEQIYFLNQQNLKANITDDEKQAEGFVTWLYSLQLLQSMHAIAPSIIVKHNNTVIAYALVTLKEAATFHKDLQDLFGSLHKLSYKGKNLFDYSFYCMGQICIHKDYRGKGIFSLLYNKHKEIYSNKYRLLITEVSTSNKRSQRAHEKLGFETIHIHSDHLDEWNVIVWDWQK